MQTIRARYIGNPDEPAAVLAAIRELKQRLETNATNERRTLRCRLAARICRWKRTTRERALRQARREVERECATALLMAEYAYQRALRTAHRECTELAVAIAKEAIEADLSIQSDFVTGQIRSQLDRLMFARRIRISGHPGDLVAIRNGIGEQSGVEFREDPTCPHGSALLTTACGSVSLDWRDSLSAVKEGLLGQIDREFSS